MVSQTSSIPKEQRCSIYCEIYRKLISEPTDVGKPRIQDLMYRRRTSEAPYIRKFGNPSISKFLVVKWLCARQKNKRVAPLPQVFLWYWASMLWLIDSCHYQVSTHQYRVTHYRGLGSKQELQGLVYFFEVDRLPSTRLLVGSRAQSRLLLCGRGGVHVKTKLPRKLNPDTLFTFLLTYYLHNRLLESPLYISYLISTILVTLIRFLETLIDLIDSLMMKEDSMTETPGRNRNFLPISLEVPCLNMDMSSLHRWPDYQSQDASVFS